MKRRTEAVLGVAILVGIVLLAVLFLFLPDAPADDEGSGSVRSSRPLGRRALYLLLVETGFDARAVADAPADLPRGRSVLWLPRVPREEMPLGPDGTRHRNGNSTRMGAHELRHYRTFVEAGGTLVLAGGEEAFDFVADTLEIEGARDLVVHDAGDAPRQQIRTSSGDVLALSSSASGRFEDLDPLGGARALWTVEDESGATPFAVELASGAGSVVLLARDDFVENRYVGEHDHALAAVRLLEDLSGGGPILFSDYEAGRFDPPSTVDLLLGPTILLATLHGLVLLALFTWMQGFSRAFPRDPEPLALFSPYLRARSLADVFTRARSRETLAKLLQRGAFARFEAIARLPRRHGGQPRTEGPALEPVAAADVSEFARQAGVADLEPRIAALVLARIEPSPRSLAEFDRDVRSMERELERRLRPT